MQNKIQNTKYNSLPSYDIFLMFAAVRNSTNTDLLASCRDALNGENIEWTDLHFEFFQEIWGDLK